MLREIMYQSWEALRRNPTRSLLTMMGIVWGIVAVTLLMAYGSGFRQVLVRGFEAFGKGAVICWPGQTSEQAGGERAGKPVKLEQADVDVILQEASLVKHACLESVKRLPVEYGQTVITSAVRGVCPIYGEMRNEVASEGRWISPEDQQDHRHVVFIGDKQQEKLFRGRPAVGEIVRISGIRFTVIGVMDRKMQLSNYFSSDDDSVFIPYSAAAELWDARYGSVLVFEPVTPIMEEKAQAQVLASVAKRQRFSPTDKRALQMYGRAESKPIIDGITIGLQVLLLFIGSLTLGIGGVGVMNIMLVSVNERIREIGLRLALGARRRHVRMQFLAEALVLTLSGGLIGIGIAYGLVAIIGPLPMLGALFEDTSGKGDLHLHIDAMTALISTGALFVTGVLSGLLPAMRASSLDPATALRYE